MTNANAAEAGIFKIGGDLAVVRLGFGAMRVTGPGIWGPPTDREEALRTLRSIPEVGMDFVDTADSYGPDISEELVREVLHPYGAVRVATKAGLTRSGPDEWTPHGDPDYLIRQAERSREILGVERIDLWQLHRIDPKVPRDEQFSAVRTLIDRGVIRHAGLSQVGIEEIKAAGKVFPVATVQNRYNLADRESEAVLDFCERERIGFIPWFPLAAGRLAGSGGVLDQIAARHQATAGQIALAWLLRRSPVILPIPGTGRVSHLIENAQAASIRLTDAEFGALSGTGH